jgi:hypothetical protein
MNLDLAIQNTLKRSPMDSAMHGVASTFGAQYELKSYTENGSLQERLFGDSVGVTAPISDMTLAKPVHQEVMVPDLGPLSESITADGRAFEVTYEPGPQRWTLIEFIPEEGLSGFFNKLLGRPNGGRKSVVVTKIGTSATHRFLTEVETSPVPEAVKRMVASLGVAALAPIDARAHQKTLETNRFDDAPDLAGTTPVSAQTFNQSNVMEMDLAAEYSGVKKLRSDHFMGDTVIPTPLSYIHGGGFRNAEGFNQNPVGQHIAPPTKMAGDTQRKNSRSL